MEIRDLQYSSEDKKWLDAIAHGLQGELLKINGSCSCNQAISIPRTEFYSVPKDLSVDFRVPEICLCSSLKSCRNY